MHVGPVNVGITIVLAGLTTAGADSVDGGAAAVVRSLRQRERRRYGFDGTGC
jgi:hypothetical protein